MMDAPQQKWGEKLSALGPVGCQTPLAAPCFSNDSQWEDKMCAAPATVSNTAGSTRFMNTPGKNDRSSLPGAAEADITNCK